MMNIENPHINIPLDNETHDLLNKFAKEESKTVTIMAASLIREAIDMRAEDLALSNYAEERLNNIKTWHSHEEVWGFISPRNP